MREDRFQWQDGDVVVSPCVLCIHKWEGTTCAAFPKKIPTSILHAEHDHKTPYAGDHGIQFEPLPDKKAAGK